MIHQVLINFMLVISMAWEINTFCAIQDTTGLNNMVITRKKQEKSTYLSSTADNRQITLMRPLQTTVLITTTISYDSCINKYSNTQSYGLFFYHDTFSLNIADLNKMTIYSGEYLIAISFEYLNGSTEIYGNIQNNNIRTATSLNLQNEDIIALNIHFSRWIKNIQFLFHNTQNNTYSWNEVLGSQGGSSEYVDAAYANPRASNFKITSISGNIDDSYVNKLKFGYTYEQCNPFSPRPTTPPHPLNPHSTIIQTTTIQITTALLTTTEMSTTTIIPGECKTLNGRSSLFGTYGSLYFLTQFNVKISDLKSIEVHSGEFVYALNFIYKNGNTLYQGFTLKDNVKIVFTIDLENKQIAALHFRSGLWINNVQFLIYDLLNKTFTWTRAFGGQGGDQTFIDAQSVAPLSSNFQITSLSGSAHPFDFIRTLRVGYSYKQCNPAEPGPTIPPTPVQPIDTTILPLTSTIPFENDHLSTGV